MLSLKNCPEQGEYKSIPFQEKHVSINQKPTIKKYNLALCDSTSVVGFFLILRAIKGGTTQKGWERNVYGLLISTEGLCFPYRYVGKSVKYPDFQYTFEISLV